MGYFNFAIDDSAEFIRGKSMTCSTRDLLKVTEAKRRWKTIAPDPVAKPPVSDRSRQNRTSPALRRCDVQQAVANPSPVKTCTYRNFKISTARPNHLGFVAYFERLDGQPILWEGTARSIVKTLTYTAEILAISDAQVSIDDLMMAEVVAAAPV